MKLAWPFSAVLLTLVFACGESSPVGPVPPPPGASPPPPPPPPPPTGNYSYGGSLVMMVSNAPQSQVTGYQVRLDGQQLFTYSGAATHILTGNFERHAQPAGGPHRLSIVITGLLQPQVEFLVSGAILVLLPGGGTQYFELPRHYRVLKVGDDVTLEFRVPLQ